MLTRRNFIVSLPLLGAATSIGWAKTPGVSENGNHAVMMLNADCGDANVLNVFEPAILRVDPGDSVIFTKGDLSGVAGGTNAMKIISVPDAEIMQAARAAD